MDEPWLDLVALRRQAKLSQTQLGHPVLSQTQVSLVEQGVLMPSVHALSHFARQLGEDMRDWSVRWAPHQQQVKRQTHLWRRFIRRDLTQLQRELDSSEETLALDCACYRKWVNLSTATECGSQYDLFSEARGASGDLMNVAALRAAVQQTPPRYLPSHMRGQGDLRLRVVLAMIEAVVSSNYQRYRSAVFWKLEAHRLFRQVPRYWM